MPITITPQEIEIRDEGSTQGNANVMDFLGSGVSVAVSGDTATVTVSGGGTVDYTQVLFVQVFS